jgi:hypothetical protein
LSFLIIFDIHLGDFLELMDPFIKRALLICLNKEVKNEYKTYFKFIYATIKDELKEVNLVFRLMDKDFDLIDLKRTFRFFEIGWVVILK